MMGLFTTDEGPHTWTSGLLSRAYVRDVAVSLDGGPVQRGALLPVRVRQVAPQVKQELGRV